jgi:hypothetical protein
MINQLEPKGTTGYNAKAGQTFANPKDNFF